MSLGIATGALVAGGLAVGSSVIQSQAAGRAAKKASDATNAANQMQADQFYQTREDNMPLMELRNALLPRIKELALQDVGVTPQEVMQEPGYQFGLQQGLQGIQNTAAARGSLGSGATLKALTRFNGDYATGRFGDALNRKQNTVTNTFNRLSSAAGLGQVGVNQTNAAGANYANNVGNNLLNNANFQSAAGMAQANSFGNLLNRGSSYLTGGLF